MRKNALCKVCGTHKGCSVPNKPTPFSQAKMLHKQETMNQKPQIKHISQKNSLTILQTHHRTPPYTPHFN